MKKSPSTFNGPVASVTTASMKWLSEIVESAAELVLRQCSEMTGMSAYGARTAEEFSRAAELTSLECQYQDV